MTDDLPSSGPDPAADTQSEALFRAVFAAAPIAQATISREATFMHVNPAGCELVGYPEHELVGREFTCVAAAESVVPTTEAFLALINRDVEAVRIDVTLLRKNGTTVLAEVFAAPVLGADGEPQYFVVLAQDVTERRRTERRMYHQAMNDGLTELPNRMWFADRLSQALARLARHPDQLLAVFFVDLDGFKAVNDEHGHMVGDETLFSAAGRIRAAVRPSDTVARYAGDEFTVLCEDLASQDDAIEIAERLVRAFHRPFRVSAGEVTLSASVGVALTAVPDSAAALISRADAAMYESKTSGKSTYRLAPPRD